jgi:hypothetical protein
LRIATILTTPFANISISLKDRRRGPHGYKWLKYTQDRYDFDYTKGVSGITTLSEIEAMSDEALHCYAFNHAL